jgi:predicted DNA-binding transcriptional regulator AlpA
MDQATKPTRFLDMGDLCERWAVSRQTLERWIREDPTFPKPVRLGPKSKIRKFTENHVEEYERAAVVRGKKEARG